MPWISNHKHKIEEKSTKSSQSSFKVVGLGLADLWEFPSLITILTFQDFSYWPEIWWDDAQYHEADYYSKWPCSANFCTEISMIGLDQVWGMMTHIRKCEDITLLPEICWCEAMYHEADYYLKWLHSANVCIFWSWLEVLSFSEHLVYHSEAVGTLGQLEIQSFLLQTELHDFTQEATQAATSISSSLHRLSHGVPVVGLDEIDLNIMGQHCMGKCIRE